VLKVHKKKISNFLTKIIILITEVDCTNRRLLIWTKKGAVRIDNHLVRVNLLWVGGANSCTPHLDRSEGQQGGRRETAAYPTPSLLPYQRRHLL